MSHAMIRLVLPLLLLAGAAALPARAASPDAADPGPKPPAVSVVRVARGALAERVVLTGTLVPREEALVSPQVEGLAITEILAEEGDRVTQGQVLARLARDTIETALAQNAAQAARAEAAIAQARASIAEAQAARTQADLAFARSRELVRGGSVSREAYESRDAAARVAAARAEAAEQALRVAEADRALADAQRRELEVRLARAEIRAPVAGVVSRRTARLGAVVGGAGEPLFRIIAAGLVELEADVPETSLAKLRPGQPATVVGAGPEREATVRLVAPEVNRTTRLGRVRVAVEGDPAGLVIGGFARATVEVARREGALVPLSAVLFQPDGATVQVVRDGTVETRPVWVGLRAGGQALIPYGLAEGEEIVSVSGTFIRGGDRVTPVAAK